MSETTAYLREVFGERFQVLGKLGTGAYGDVYRARDKVLGRDVAIKRIRVDPLADSAEREESKRRFLREAQVASQLRHPNIVITHDIVSTDEMSFMVMELVTGETLGQLLSRNGRLSLSETLEVLAQVAAALDCAHQNQLVHRDVKPSNIMIESSGHVKVMDFGIAKKVSGQSHSDSGHIVGTPNYMSPEQARGERLDGRSDLFSLGCLLYECLTGEKAFGGEIATTTLLKVLTEEPRPVDFAAIGVPEELGLVLRRAIAKQASERFSSGAELMEAARAAATGKPIDARGPSTVRSTAPFPMMRRGHWRRIVPLLTGAIVVAGLAGFLWSRSEYRVSRTARGLIVEEQPGFLAKLLGAKPRRVITVPKATRLALALETPLTSGTARVGHPFTAALREPIQVEGFVVVAAGSRIRGRVSRAEPAGQSASPGRLSLKADTLVLPNGDQIPIETGATSFAGQSPSKKDGGFLGSIGGKVSGLFGGKNEKRDPLPEAVLAEGTTFSLSLTAPFAVGRPIEAEVE